VRHTHERTSTRILDAIGDALDKLKRSEASVATAKLMTALAVLNTSDSTQAWACLLLALPLYHDHLANTALKVPSAAQQTALWTTSAGLRLLGATRAAADMLLLPLLRRPSASIEARVRASRAHAAAVSQRVTSALRRLDGAASSVLRLASSGAAATAADALRSVGHTTSARPSAREEEPQRGLWDLASSDLETVAVHLAPALISAGWCFRAGATSATGATTIRTAAALLGTALARATIQMLSLNAIVSTASLACAAAAAHVASRRSTQGTCLMLLCAFAGSWQYTSHFIDTPYAASVAEATGAAALTATGTVANCLTSATSTTAAGAVAAAFISITQVTGRRKEPEQPAQRDWYRPWGGGIERRLQWDEDAFECSGDRTIRFLGPGLRRLSRLGPKASGHKKGKQREPTQGLGGTLQRMRRAHHERLAHQQQYKAYISKEDSRPDTSQTLSTES
jgi:hypothetical protein